jgi:hypothetical protein
VNQYREGKVKSTLNKGVKENLKPYAYKRSELLSAVTACLLHNEPTSYSSLARLRNLSSAAGAKASLNRALKSEEVDAKLGDLPMGRLKWR